MSMIDSSSSSIVRITGGANSHYRVSGTGFIVHQDKRVVYVLTCDHVVAKIESGNSIEVDGIQGCLLASGSQQNLDLAVLEVPGFLSRTPLPLDPTGLEGDEFIIKGFYEADSNRTNLLREVQGYLGPPEASVRSKDGEDILVWDLHLREGDILEHGYSGAPVIHKETGCVMGVVSHKVVNGRGLAISISSIMKIWPDMPLELLDSRRGYSSLYANWCSSKSKKMTDQDPYRALRLSHSQKDIATATRREVDLSEEIDAIISELGIISDAVNITKVKRRKDQLEKERREVREELKELLALQSKI
jgi:Trypsin-like peptidase domain